MYGNDIPERIGGSELKNTSRNAHEETYDEMYTLTNNATFGKKEQIDAEEMATLAKHIAANL